ncbi:hypothetical protein LB553_07825 [Mesorhizobium sp. CA8]|uniref:hypothetical protein n=1 Tax=Mesorhizobium sp. CA8 TaxID=2876637 RepID=UPI001CCFB441|nr:hypothetical protein [Mesorhizobium sp. CA8]MBZ9760785.1 hypothetical protein [Mesorhizobium sp. CA8]
MAAFPPGKTASENKKPDCSLQSGKVARSGEEKASHMTARLATVEPTEKFHGKSIVAEKITCGMAAMQMLHCTIFSKSPIS